MSRFDRTCLICKSHYDFCPNCGDYDNQPRWKALFCSENCHDIFNVTNDYSHHMLTQEEAKKKLEGLDLSKRGKITGSIKDSIDEIFGDKKKETVKEEVAKDTEKESEATEKNDGEIAHDATTLPESVQKTMQNFNNFTRNKKRRH